MTLEWFLVIVLASNTTGLVPLQRFETRERCEQQLAVEALHLAVTRREVISAHCQHVRQPQLRATAGETLR